MASHATMSLEKLLYASEPTKFVFAFEFVLAPTFRFSNGQCNCDIALFASQMTQTDLLYAMFEMLSDSSLHHKAEFNKTF